MILMLLAAADASGVASEVVSHPYLTVTIIGALFSSLVGIVKVFLSLFEKRVNEKFEEIKQREEERETTISNKFKEVHEREEKQEVRLDKIDEELQGYDKHVAVGVKETAEIHAAVKRTEAAISDHVHKEENTTWKKIDDLVISVNEMKLSNEVAHAGLVAGQTVLSNRVEAVERKMPNGELEKLASAYHALAQQDAGISRRPTPKKRRAKR